MTGVPLNGRLLRGEFDSVLNVLELLRTGAASTRQELEALTGLGRAVVADRVATLIEKGLVEETDLAPSTRGRPPIQIRFRAEAGVILVGAIGHTSLGVGLADLSGRLIVEHHEHSGADLEAELTQDRLEELLEWVASANPDAGPVWGVSLSVPAAVEQPSRPGALEPIVHLSPAWAASRFAERLQARFAVPVWIDSDAHLMALGELRAGHGVGRSELLFLKIGSVIGAGLVLGGQIQRGARGYAGDIGHVTVTDTVVCRCGNVGCLEAVASGAAIARAAAEAAASGESAYLAGLARDGRRLSAADVGIGAYRADPFCVELLVRCGERIGGVLAVLVSALNPSIVVVGGGVAQAGEVLLSAMREALFRQTRSLATRDVSLVRSELGRTGALVGAAMAAIDDLFSRDRVRTWISVGHPPLAQLEQVAADGPGSSRGTNARSTRAPAQP